MSHSLPPRTHGSSPDAPTLAAIGERAWLRRVRRRFIADLVSSGDLGIGDDAAVIAHPGSPLVVTTDSLIENVHFRWKWTDPRRLAAKALAVNLSDLAAMGAAPTAALLALSFPSSVPAHALEAFFTGFRAAARRWACPLVGGDLTRAPQWVVNVTVFGRPSVANRTIRRDAARPGMRLYVTGSPGESGAGLAALETGVPAPRPIRRHLQPVPRLAEAAALAAAAPALAMLDVSDGLWNDADQLAEASCVGLEIDQAALPLSPVLRRLGAQLGRDPMEWVLFGGEDYELLLASQTPPDRLRAAFASAGLRTPLHPIGRVVPRFAGSGNNVRLLMDGKPIPVVDRTFRHFA